MQQRVIYSSDLLASLLSAYLPAKPMDVMIQVLSCVLLFFSMPIAPVFYPFGIRSHNGMVRCFARSCVPVRGHVLKSSSSKDAAILEYFGCPLVVVLLQSISMTLAPLPFCPFVFY